MLQHQLTIEIEELRREKERLQREASTFRHELEGVQRQLNQSRQECHNSQIQSLNLSAEVQQLHETNLKLTRDFSKHENQFALEREALEATIKSSDSRLKQACALERQQTSNLTALEEKYKILEESLASCRKRQHVETAIPESQFTLRIRELEAENFALANGLAITERTEQLSAENNRLRHQLEVSQQEVHRLQETRRHELQYESELSLCQKELAELKQRFAVEFSHQSEHEACREELQRWQRLGKNPEQVSVSLQFVSSLLLEKKQGEETHSRLLHSQTEVKDLLEKLRKQTKELEMERDATELVLRDAFQENATLTLEFPQLKPLRERVSQLEKELKACQEQKMVTTLPSKTAGDKKGMDAEIAYQPSIRAKEKFQTHLLLWKQAVFLLFGWKLEMTPEESKPVIKLTRPGGNATKQVLFRMDASSGQLDLLQESGNSSALAFLTQFQSPPAFMALVTLDTVMNNRS